MNKETQEIAEYNTRVEQEKVSRFLAAMVFCSAILYWLWF